MLYFSRHFKEMIAALFLTLASGLFLFVAVWAVGGSTWNHEWVMDIDVSTVDATFLGVAASDSTGRYSTIVGDINGDGFEDIVLGASNASGSTTVSGTAYVIAGKASGWSQGMLLSDSSNLLASFIGEALGDQAGHGVTAVGDVNGDGLKDFIIGSVNNDINGDGSGQAYLILGKTSGWGFNQNLGTTADASFWGVRTGDGIGQTSAGVGDVNADGYDDFTLCSIVNDDSANNAGQCWLLYGKASGWAMDQDLGTPGVAAASFVGTASDSDFFGIAAGYGDINGDGIADFGIGASGNDDAGSGRGQVYIFFGAVSPGWTVSSSAYSAANATFVGETNDDALSGNAGPGDLNGDGLMDMIFSASLNDEVANNSGKVYIVFGKRDGWAKGASIATADASYVGEAASQTPQVTNGKAGDVNGDGYADIFMTAQANAEGGTQSGQVYLIFGKASGWTTSVSLSNADASFLGARNGDFLGDRLGRGGDVNGDRTNDLIIGAAPNDDVANNAGKSYLIFGTPHAPTQLSLSSPNDSEVDATWSSSGYPATMQYYAENTSNGTNSGWMSANSWASTGLGCATPYTIRVKARNTPGVESAFAQATINQTTCNSGGGASSGGGGGGAPAPEPAAVSVPVPSFTLDPPTITSPQEDEQVTTLPFFVIGTASSSAQVSVAIGGSTYTVAATASGTFAIPILDQLIPGDYTILSQQSTSSVFSATSTRLITYVLPSPPIVVEASSTPPAAPVVVVPKPAKPVTALPKSPVKPLLPPSPTVAEVTETLNAVTQRKAFLLVLNTHTPHFYKQQIENIEASANDTFQILIRPTEPVHSITARLYDTETGFVSPLSIPAAPRQSIWNTFVHWFAPVLHAAEVKTFPWIKGYIFEKVAGLDAYHAKITVPSGHVGTYALVVTLNGLDGSRTTITKYVRAVEKGVVYAGVPDRLEDRVQDARVTIYSQKDNNTFSPWGAVLYGETNPIFTDAQGEYAVSLPAGTYYFTVDAPSFAHYESKVFVFSVPAIIHDPVLLTQKNQSWWDRFWRWVKE